MDYLAYAILDSIVDEYFVSIEKMGDRIEEIDDEILSAPDAVHMSEIHRMKREIVFSAKSRLAASGSFLRPGEKYIGADRGFHQTISAGPLRPHHTGHRHGGGLP